MAKFTFVPKVKVSEWLADTPNNNQVNCPFEHTGKWISE